ncbi:AraC family transcriptional regulator [Pseudomarimonas salicorniae]|uniref:AraC family transcriptional regulator n=1 Tax=Pseudomarimonas salicorniae TaxID=2933270 RepID=A0ABT0GCM4_9GAMM|nr:AraC family transcriptional regulator [Lysobacter sp. CAU 1642]MCK7592271.1 AraC family transcriptional regulator [Lysobacter sp. CAU 1642]
MSVSPDRLSAVLAHFRVRAELFHAGPLCGLNRFELEPGRGFLHVLKRGELLLRHGRDSGLPRSIEVREPSVVFYPRALHHEFENPPIEGADFTCATIRLEGGDHSPLARALPPLLLMPLGEIEGLDQSLALLFAETERQRCGQRLLADRLFEVVLIQLLRWLLDHPERAGVPAGLLRGLSEPRLARALVALHEAPAKPWSLESLAEAAGMSRSAFAARFKQCVGQSPGDYLADWRLALAQSRLQQGRSLKQVTAEVGYANPSALSRLFRQRTGVSPRSWLKGVARAADRLGDG